MPACLDHPCATSSRSASGDSAARLEILAETPLPTRHGLLRCLVFSLSDQPQREHVAMLAGVARGEDLLVRMHSECLTSEVFGSLRCDCRARLDLALERIAREGRGVLIYRRRTLEPSDDTGCYEAAAALLKRLGVESVRLLSSGPTPSAELEALGIRVHARVPLAARHNAYPHPTPNLHPNEMA
jgi:GTP cyclohydrolase II